jgi:hypothetical protein
VNEGNETLDSTDGVKVAWNAVEEGRDVVISTKGRF